MVDETKQDDIRQQKDDALLEDDTLLEDDALLEDDVDEIDAEELLQSRKEEEEAYLKSLKESLEKEKKLEGYVTEEQETLEGLEIYLEEKNKMILALESSVSYLEENLQEDIKEGRCSAEDFKKRKQEIKENQKNDKNKEELEEKLKESKKEKQKAITEFLILKDKEELRCKEEEIKKLEIEKIHKDQEFLKYSREREREYKEENRELLKKEQKLKEENQKNEEKLREIEEEITSRQLEIIGLKEEELREREINVLEKENAVLKAEEKRLREAIEKGKLEEAKLAQNIEELQNEKKDDIGKKQEEIETLGKKIEGMKKEKNELEGKILRDEDSYKREFGVEPRKIKNDVFELKKLVEKKDEEIKEIENQIKKNELKKYGNDSIGLFLFEEKKLEEAKKERKDLQYIKKLLEAEKQLNEEYKKTREEKIRKIFGKYYEEFPENLKRSLFEFLDAVRDHEKKKQVDARQGEREDSFKRVERSYEILEKSVTSNYSSDYSKINEVMNLVKFAEEEEKVLFHETKIKEYEKLRAIDFEEWKEKKVEVEKLKEDYKIQEEQLKENSIVIKKENDRLEEKKEEAKKMLAKDNEEFVEKSIEKNKATLEENEKILLKIKDRKKEIEKKSEELEERTEEYKEDINKEKVSLEKIKGELEEFTVKRTMSPELKAAHSVVNEHIENVEDFEIKSYDFKESEEKIKINSRRTGGDSFRNFLMGELKKFNKNLDEKIFDDDKDKKIFDDDDGGDVLITFNTELEELEEIEDEILEETNKGNYIRVKVLTGKYAEKIYEIAGYLAKAGPVESYPSNFLKYIKKAEEYIKAKKIINDRNVAIPDGAENTAKVTCCMANLTEKERKETKDNFGLTITVNYSGDKKNDGFGAKVKVINVNYNEFREKVKEWRLFRDYDSNKMVDNLSALIEESNSFSDLVDKTGNDHEINKFIAKIFTAKYVEKAKVLESFKISREGETSEIQAPDLYMVNNDSLQLLSASTGLGYRSDFRDFDVEDDVIVPLIEKDTQEIKSVLNQEEFLTAYSSHATKFLGKADREIGIEFSSSLTFYTIAGEVIKKDDFKNPGEFWKKTKDAIDKFLRENLEEEEDRKIVGDYVFSSLKTEETIRIMASSLDFIMGSGKENCGIDDIVGIAYEKLLPKPLFEERYIKEQLEKIFVDKKTMNCKEVLSIVKKLKETEKNKLNARHNEVIKSSTCFQNVLSKPINKKSFISCDAYNEGEYLTQATDGMLALHKNKEVFIATSRNSKFPEVTYELKNKKGCKNLMLKSVYKNNKWVDEYYCYDEENKEYKKTDNKKQIKDLENMKKDIGLSYEAHFANKKAHLDFKETQDSKFTNSDLSKTFDQNKEEVNFGAFNKNMVIGEDVDREKNLEFEVLNGKAYEAHKEKEKRQKEAEKRALSHLERLSEARRTGKSNGDLSMGG